MKAATFPPVRVAVIDSGWRRDVIDARVTQGEAFCADDEPLKPHRSCDVDDRIGHGTDCTRIILAVAPRCLVTPLRVFHTTLETSPSVLCAALEWAAAEAFDIVSLSLSTRRRDVRNVLYVLCQRLRHQGTVVVSATTNGTQGGYPAIFDNVVGVAVSPDGGDPRFMPRSGDGVDFIVRTGWFDSPLKRGLHPSLHTTSYAAAFIAGRIAHQIQLTGQWTLGETGER